MAVVGDRDPGGTALAHVDLDAPGFGVEGVLDQLLDDGGRPLDDLAGRDLVDQGVLEAADRTPFPAAPRGSARHLPAFTPGARGTHPPQQHPAQAA